MDGPVPELTEHAAACAARLRDADRVLLASHIDADGLTSAGIASTALERAGIPFETVFCRQLDEAAVADIAATDYDTVLFTDFGSGQLDIIAEYEAAGDFHPVIADHHQPAEGVETDHHLNPLRFGLNGASELSGAGASYVLARALEPESADGHSPSARETGSHAGDNRDLAALAVVGAVGDMQDTNGELRGANAGIVDEGVEAGVVEEGTDLRIYGRQTRALPKLLQYATDVRIPGISNNEAGAIEFLTELDVPCRDDDGEWKRWVDLTGDERQTLASALIRRAIASGVPASRIDDLVGTTYVLSREQEGTELRDVSEFSTLLNATARYDRADVGLAVCLGERDAALDRARRLLRNHRKNLSNGLQWVKEHGVRVEDNLQWFDAGDEIRETIVGIVAGMAVGTNATRSGIPVLAFADTEEGEVKVSSRGSYVMVRDGLDLSAVMREASRSVGGDGGGHDVAAGATIPKGEVEAFIAEADRIVGEQLAEDSD
ncbi:recombinase RecJ [Haloferax sp. Atlit-12N]|uniref:single-stranded-DNA-specific exonuclease RecJ n=1 Tax=Haloferax sp. Atlit-12N TaxID=2077203 RepID=UPI000E2755C3|nr:DHH family phosphoesterase [Haloferax sp. Atlit-12N]RDZ66169.1 recombinase RecJ [Haloferax sp. Atlit-12N]